MSVLEDSSRTHVTPYDADVHSLQRQSKTYSNIHISGNARVHLGDAYYDHLTIDQLCLVRQTNDAIVQQIGNLHRLAESSDSIVADHLEGEGAVQQHVIRMNDNIASCK
jgi:hypothetical protein